MRGRKPLPTHIKQARGNPGKRPLNKNEPKPGFGIPTCPSFFDADAKREWKRMLYLLLKSRILTELDTQALILYCHAFSRWMNAERNLKKYGDVILTPDKKFPVQSPYLAIANKAQEQMVKIMIEFGMTPSSRSRVHATPHHGPSSMALYRAGLDGSGEELESEPETIEEALQQEMAKMEAEQKDRDEQEEKAQYFFGPRLNRAEQLLERARLSRERRPTFDSGGTTHSDESGDAPQS